MTIEDRRRLWALPLVLAFLAAFAGCDGDDDRDAGGGDQDDDAFRDDDVDDEARVDADLVVDAGRIDGLLNRRLIGGHVHDSRPTPEQLALQPAFWRRVASAANRMHWDCGAETFTPETLAEYHDWLDAVQEAGVEPMIALSYVPECLSENGHPKAPPLPDRAADYETYVRSFLHEFVSGRIEQGKAPLRYFEAWNETDLPFSYANVGHGHGFVGLLDDFEQRVFVPLGHAVMGEEAVSGTDIEFGVAASFESRPFIETYPHLEDLMRVAGVTPDLASFLGPLAELGMDLIFPDGFAGQWSRGGFAWPDRLVARAEDEGIGVDFVSWHHYLSNPFGGPSEGCLPEALWFLQQPNPLADVYEYYQDAQDYRQRYPGKELLLTEWGLGCSDGAEYGFGAFHAAALIAMQQGGMDAAISLSFPTEGATAIAHRMFTRMADHVVERTLNEDGAVTGVWTLTSVDGAEPRRLTLLAAQWHSLAEDAVPRDLDVAILGLPPGDYEVAAYLIDQEHEGSTDPDEVYDLAVVAGLPARIRVPLHGIAAAFVEMSRAEGGGGR